MSAQGLLGLPAPDPAPRPAAELQLLTGVLHGQSGCVRSPHPEHRPTPSRPRAGRLFQSAASAGTAQPGGRADVGSSGRGDPAGPTRQSPHGRETGPGKARGFKGGTGQAQGSSQGPRWSPKCPHLGRRGPGKARTWEGAERNLLLTAWRLHHQASPAARCLGVSVHRAARGCESARLRPVS